VIIIFDFYYTLFNNKKFYKDLAKIFDLSIKEFKKQYNIFFKNKKINYSFTKYIAFLKTNNLIKTKEEAKIRKNFNNLIKKFKIIFFPKQNRP